MVLDNCVGVSTNPYQRGLSSYTNSDQFLGYVNSSFSQGQPDAIDHGPPYSYPVEVEFSLHEGGSSAPRTGPSLQLFYNCTVTKTGTFHAPADPAPLHVADIGSGEKDVFIWVDGPDGRIDKGVDRHQINIAGVLPRGAVGSNSRYIVDPAIKDISFLSDVSNAPRRLTRKVTSPLPLPRHGMTPATRAFYYPSALHEARSLTVPGSDITTGELVANRLYFVPFHIERAMNLAKVLAFIATGATGHLGAAFYVADHGRTALWTSPPVVLYGRLSRPQPSVSGANVMTMNEAAPRTVFPGMGQAWIALVSDSAVPNFSVLTLNSAPEQCYYQDLPPGWLAPPIRASAVALPAGSVVPRVGLATI